MGVSDDREGEGLEERLRAFLRERRNWGRWGSDDQLGTANLVTTPSADRPPRLCAWARRCP
jgi:hypothetical protein